jgi:hypothetical protein
MSVTRAEVEQRFRDFDAAYFEGRLAGRTCVELLVPTQGNHLAQPEDGACKYDGSVIYLNPRSEHDWEGTLLHEMVHAFECCFGEQLAESEEGRSPVSAPPFLRWAFAQVLHEAVRSHASPRRRTSSRPAPLLSLNPTARHHNLHTA